eukprot:862183_1
MSTEPTKKRKIVFWHPPRIKKRRLNTKSWYKNKKPITPTPISKNENKSNDNDNDTFEIVKISKPNAFNSTTIDTNEPLPSSSSSTLKIKFAT